MDTLQKMSLVPTKLRYKLMISFCLMSVVPLLIGGYIASLFIKFPFQADPATMMTVSGVMFFSLLLSFFGYRITQQMITPITASAQKAKDIVRDLNGQVETKGEDELEDLSNSLKTIQTNATELLKKVERLSLEDKLTGLYNATYIRERLHEEIHRAVYYQRPCAFAYFMLVGFESYRQSYGEVAANRLLQFIAQAFSKPLSEFDRAARVQGDNFVVILPDKNKKKAIESVEGICRTINDVLDETTTGQKMIRISIGISENPIDGVSATELFDKARERAKIGSVKKTDSIEAFA